MMEKCRKRGWESERFLRENETAAKADDPSRGHFIVDTQTKDPLPGVC